MYQGKPITPLQAGGLTMPPSRRPKGLGRRNPHSGFSTRKKFTNKTEKQYSANAIKISNGLDKISLFFTGTISTKNPVINSLNPFKNMMDMILNRKGKTNNV